MGRKVHTIFASFRDKNIALMLPEIGLLGDITITTFDNARAREEMDYFLYLADYKYVGDYKQALKELLEAYPDDVILITGSLTFTYVVREYLKESGLLK